MSFSVLLEVKNRVVCVEGHNQNVLEEDLRKGRDIFRAAIHSPEMVKEMGYLY